MGKAADADASEPKAQAAKPVLIANDHDRHHAFRLGPAAWGVQFHPAFDADIVRAFTCARDASLRADGLNPDAILAAIEETPEAASILARFGQIATGGAVPAR